ncbi:MAG: hypothetical protein IJ417_04500 [Bacteroidaceae bacterium]|nr:hypothetical protein [Bacteroidaceae bacterium]
MKKILFSILIWQFALWGAQAQMPISAVAVPKSTPRLLLSDTGGAETLYTASMNESATPTSEKVKTGKSTAHALTATKGKTVVSIEYYNVVGVKLSKPEKGLNIVKKTMSDGTTVTTKLYIK